MIVGFSSAEKLPLATLASQLTGLHEQSLVYLLVKGGNLRKKLKLNFTVEEHYLFLTYTFTSPLFCFS
jgi:hypothetical protein